MNQEELAHSTSISDGGPGLLAGETNFGSPLKGIDVEFYEYECGSNCTVNGCVGHDTDIPVGFALGGIYFEVSGAASGDFPSDKATISQVKLVVEELGKYVGQRDDLLGLRNDLRELAEREEGVWRHFYNRLSRVLNINDEPR